MNLVRNDFERKCAKNPRYSLRAYAHFLEIDPSLLSKLINGKRKLAKTTQLKITKKLKIPELILTEENKYHKVKEDHLEYLSNSEFDVVLESLKLESFKPDLSWLSKTLKLSKEKLNNIVKKLSELNLLNKNSVEWTDNTLGYSSNILDSEISSYARREYQKRIFEKSLESIENIDYKDRDHSSIIVASNSEKIREAKEKIKRFRREIIDFLSETENKNTIYQMAIGIHPLINEEKE